MSNTKFPQIRIFLRIPQFGKFQNQFRDHPNCGLVQGQEAVHPAGGVPHVLTAEVHQGQGAGPSGPLL